MPSLSHRSFSRLIRAGFKPVSTDEPASQIPGTVREQGARPCALFALSIFFFIVCCLVGKAVPPNPNLWLHSESARREYAQNPPDPIRQAARLQPDGIEFALVLRVDFSDKPGKRSRAELDGYLFDRETASLAAYYDEASYGNMRIEPGPAGGSYPTTNTWYRMPRPMSFYGESKINVERSMQLVQDACNAADKDVNFKDYDRDGDGYIDHLILLHAGNDEASTGVSNDIWSILVPAVAGVWDNVSAAAAVLIGEEPDAPKPHFGVWFHEFFHDLGAPETYMNGSFVTANDQQYCLMGLYGPYQGPGRNGTQPSHICGYLKWDFDGIPENGRVGWITPIELDANSIGQSIPAFSLPEGEAPLFKLDIPGTDGKEFFLLENRSQRAGAKFDTALPDEGLLIWHVDESVSRSSFTVAPRLWVEDPADPEHRNQDNGEITADAAYAAEDDQTAFSPSTLPDSDANDGSPSEISVLNISPSGATMTFDLFRGDTYEPNDSAARAYPVQFDNSYDSFLFDADDKADFYSLDVSTGMVFRVEVLTDRAVEIEIALRNTNGTILSVGRPLRDNAGRLNGYEITYRAGTTETLYLEIRPKATVTVSLAYELSLMENPESPNAPPRFIEAVVMPNPVRRGNPLRVRVAFASAGVEVLRAVLFDVAGTKIQEAELTDIASGNALIEIPSGDLEHLAPGVYFMLLTAERNGATAKRLTKVAVE